jgi:hypothetical protein
MIRYSDPSKNVADPPSIAELLEVLEPMRIERERKQAIRDGLAPVSLLLPSLLRISLMTSLAEVEIASTVVNLVISPLIVLKRRSREEVVAVELATNVVKMDISLETVHQSLPEGVGIVSIVVSRVICLRTVPRKGSQGEVEGALVMGAERKVTSLETVLRRLVGVVVAVASIVGKTVISYVFLTLFGT